jgi:HPt (histidine-containing phosphotransfer) domain-containing protein
MSSEPRDPGFDPQVINGMLETFGDPAPVVKMIRLFLEEAPKEVDAVAEGLSRGDPEAVRRSAHSLKSSAASMGAKDLSDVSARVEGLVRAGEMDDVPPLVELMRTSLSLASAILASEAVRVDPLGGGGPVTPPPME